MTRSTYYIHNFKLHTGLIDNQKLPGNIVIYEVIRINKAKPVFLSEHLERFAESIKLAGFSLPISFSKIPPAIQLLIKTENKEEGNIRFSYVFNEKGKADFYAYFIPHYYPIRKEYEEGVKVSIIHTERRTANAKIWNSDYKKLTEEKIRLSGVFEVLLCNSSGYITEGSRSNVFFIKNDTLFTPPAHMVLKGITRDKVIQIAKNIQLPCQEIPVPLSEIQNFEAVFLTGTSIHILPVKEIDHKTYDIAHPTMRLLMAKFRLCFESDKNKMEE